MKKKQYKIILIFCFVILLLSLIFFGINKSSSISKSNIKNIESPSESGKNTGVITIVAGEKTWHVTANIGSSLYDTLLSARENKQIAFTGKNYPGLGFFVTDIDSLHDGNGGNLIYYVNGKEATVGVSAYIINNNDVILWKLE